MKKEEIVKKIVKKDYKKLMLKCLKIFLLYYCNKSFYKFLKII